MIFLYIALAAVVLAIGITARELILAATRHGRHEQRGCECCEVTGYDGPQDRDDGHCSGCGHGLLWHFVPHELPPERSREELGFSAELRALPAPGKDIYTDHNVVLPYTRQIWQPPRPPSTAELDELKDRYDVAQKGGDGQRSDAPDHRGPGWPVNGAPEHDEDEVLDICAGCQNDEHCDGMADGCVCTCTWGEDWDEEDENEEPDPFIARAERKATDTDVRVVTCAAPARPADMEQPVSDDAEPEDWAESTFVGALLALPLDRVAEAFEGLRHA